MKNRIMVIVVFTFILGNIMAQNERDAYRYSEEEVFGTARYMSLAGSMGAFGADFSPLTATNPAAIGLYKRSEFICTPYLAYNKDISTYNNTEKSASKYKFSLGNMSFVTSINLTNGKWKSFQLATGYNQTASYNMASHVKGVNNGVQGKKVSFLDYLAPLCDGINSATIGSGNTLADILWNHWLIDESPTISNKYETTPITNDIQQRQVIENKGYKGEYVFSGGANYDDKLFFGMTIGIPFFDFQQRKIYSEGYLENIQGLGFDSLSFEDIFRSKATGINFKFGIIYQPVEYVRLGLGFHTPTFYAKVRESYLQTLSLINCAFLDTAGFSFNSYDFDFAEGNFNWALITPYKFTANAAFILPNLGFLNVDYELKDYSAMKMQADIGEYDFAEENDRIKEYFKTTHTLKIGAEFMIHPIAIRLGYAYTSNPYRNLQKDGSRHTISGGIGFKTTSFFMDFAYVYKMYQDKDIFYSVDNLNPYHSKRYNQNFVLSFGWKIGKL